MKRQLIELDLEIKKKSLVELCRNDINAFIEHVFKIKQHSFHRRFQELANTHQYLCIDAPVEHGKTFQATARVLWLLGKNPNHSIALISNAVEHPQRCLSVIRQYIEESDEVHEIFPDLKMKQDTKGEITVERSVSTQRDASVIAIGITGTIIGRRWTGAILDDFQDFDSTWTHEQRTKLKKILESTVLNRVVGNGFVLDVGTPWHVEDARHWLRKLPGFHFERFDANDMLWPDEWTDPQTGITWGWTKERLEDKRKRMSELEWNRQFRCISSSGSFAIFSADSISACLDRGRGLRLSRPAPDNRPVVTGIDLAIKKQDSADKTVFCTGCVNEGGVKEILEIRAGHWELSEIARQVLDTIRRYPNHLGFRVESNAAQAYMLQALTSPTIMKALGATDNEIGNMRIYSHFTGPRKYDPMVGIRSLAADFDHQRVKLPCSKDKVPEAPMDELITGLISFDPMAHTSDYVMAYYLFVEMTRRFWTDTKGGFADLGVW